LPEIAQKVTVQLTQSFLLPLAEISSINYSLGSLVKREPNLDMGKFLIQTGTASHSADRLNLNSTGTGNAIQFRSVLYVRWEMCPEQNGTLPSTRNQPRSNCDCNLFASHCG
jgi:hypothetical protein